MDPNDENLSPELRPLILEVLNNDDSYETWEKLVVAAEAQEGGLTRNSSPHAIESFRAIYDRFLAKFPLFFGFWKKYADFEFAIAGTEASVNIYERGVASVTNSVDLWLNYCNHKNETSHDPDVIRELFERGAACVGLDFMSHPFWDKYIDFEERLEAHDRVFALLGRIIHIPLHQYARYFERFRQLAQSRPLNELVPSETLAQFRAEIEMEAGPSGKNETEMDRELRSRIDRHHLEIFNKTQNETTQRWPFEQQIKRPYFHVTDIDDEQLGNWRKYLEFEENEGNRERIIFLYERCVAAAAYYEEFWLRYTRWMLGQMVKADEIRFIYIRASCYFVPIARPMIRLQWALFEEREQRVAVAQAIYESMLLAVPDMVEAIVAWANSRRRHSGLDAAVGIYQDHVDSNIIENAAKASLIAEWAKLLWNAKRSPEEARQLFQQYQHVFTDNKTFWDSFLTFEMEQSLGTDTEDSRYNNVKSVIDEIRKKSNLPADAVRDLGQRYMNYLLERGTKDVAKEYLELDRLLNHG